MMIGSALLVLSTSAFASQARLQALGMSEVDNDGMYYISDSRNIFLNPAHITGLSDQVMMDWGNQGAYVSATGNASDATVRTDYAPKAQGGVIKNMVIWYTVFTMVMNQTRHLC